MSTLNESIQQAVADREVNQLLSLIKDNEFILISNSEDDEGQNFGAFVAEIEDMEALLVFSTNEVAKSFVDDADTMIAADDEIDGIIIEGEALLQYLPKDYGILLDAESDDALIIEPELIKAVKDLMDNATSEP